MLSPRATNPGLSLFTLARRQSQGAGLHIGVGDALYALGVLKVTWLRRLARMKRESTGFVALGDTINSCLLHASTWWPSTIVFRAWLDPIAKHNKSLASLTGIFKSGFKGQSQRKVASLEDTAKVGLLLARKRWTLDETPDETMWYRTIGKVFLCPGQSKPGIPV